MTSTRPSSSGWRSASTAVRLNSGSSSRNSTPRCASVISPGIGRAPPPTSPCGEIVWCGARNGRSAASLPLPMPATLCTWVISSASSNVGRRQDPGQPPREHRLAGAGRADHEQVVAARRRDLERALGVRLAADVGEVDRALGARGRRQRRLDRVGLPAPVEQVGEPRERRHSADGRPLRRAPPRARSSPERAAACSPRRGRPARRRARPGSGGSRPTATARPPARSRRAPRPARARLPRAAPTAIARSKPGPALRTCAGARLTVIRCCGKPSSELSSAARTRSRDSRTARSGRPTRVNVGSPRRTSTSTVTSWLRMPSRAKVLTAASTAGHARTGRVTRGDARVTSERKPARPILARR